MPLISKQRLQDLEYKATMHDETNKEDRKAARNFERELRRQTRAYREEFEDREDELIASHRAEVKKLASKVTDAQEKAEAETKQVRKSADAEVEKAKAAAEAAESKVAALQSAVDQNGDLVERELAVTARELKVELREQMVEHAADTLDDEQRAFSSEVKAHAQEVAVARTDGEEIGEKRGYANGLADGVRAIGETTEKAHERAANMGDKAQDALIAAVSKATPQPTVTMLPVPTVTTVAAKSNK